MGGSVFVGEGGATIPISKTRKNIYWRESVGVEVFVVTIAPDDEATTDSLM